ncbi:hypothetical protein G7Y89_g5886 [Cudoniella acicularis]|uniref:Uncharacterized protein n=1 Tax=Cudoniella acicularis TaxID=354080 RepID=A0A8H4W3D8_9HELO|nr:hypothetical protein G7Y89_g5886 [Cudoniella acicularis]
MAEEFSRGRKNSTYETEEKPGEGEKLVERRLLYEPWTQGSTVKAQAAQSGEGLKAPSGVAAGTCIFASTFNDPRVRAQGTSRTLARHDGLPLALAGHPGAAIGAVSAVNFEMTGVRSEDGPVMAPSDLIICWSEKGDGESASPRDAVTARRYAADVVDAHLSRLEVWDHPK